jgi:ATP-dependent DNA helicase MPH1
VIELSSSDEYDCDFDVSMDTLEAIDNAQPPRWGPSTYRGIVAQQSTPASVVGNAVAGPSKTSNAPYKLPTYQASRQSVQTHLPFRPLSQKKTGKKWDRTAFAKTGRPTGHKKGKSKARKKSSEWDDDSEDHDDEEQALEFDQFPRPFVDPSGLPGSSGSRDIAY